MSLKVNTLIDYLVLKGPIACCRIRFGKGVCGSSWKQEETIVVEDVDKFPGHIGSFINE